ncbi:MAG: hypothetical protein K2F73_00275, partial [Ruminococcus sp.]|nr:hypothetical protein [Ruminococcus sp.]
AMKKIYFAFKKVTEIILKPFKKVYVILYAKVDNKFVRNPENSVKKYKKTSFLLLNKMNLLYNKKENKKRKNVKNVAEEAKTKAKEKEPI